MVTNIWLIYNNNFIEFILNNVCTAQCINCLNLSAIVDVRCGFPPANVTKFVTFCRDYVLKSTIDLLPDMYSNINTTILNKFQIELNEEEATQIFQSNARNWSYLGAVGTKVVFINVV